MPNQRDSIPIIRTKLHQPIVAADAVPRIQPLQQLARHEKTPLILVVAPAGYGKSTLVGQWIERGGQDAAWLSLEDADNELRVFLSYIVAAMRSLRPGSCERLAALIRNKDLPPAPDLAWELNEEIEQLERPAKLVLDDYHRISNPAIHEIIEFQIRHASPRFQWVLSCRRDPPFRLASFQARNLVFETRLRDLMFSLDETKHFLRAAVDLELSDREMADLHESMEGWAVGLRLVSLALRGSSDPEKLIRDLPDGHPRVQRYLMEEVLSDLDPVHRDCISRVALLDRYCEPLNRAVCGEACQSCSPGLNCMFALGQDGQGMLWNPLSIPLDGEGEWFRYHHQFQQLLRERVLQELSADAVQEIYLIAAEWFENQGYVDEAIHYALKCSPAAAVAIVSRRRHDHMNTESWVQVRRWLDLFDQDLIDATPELLLLQAWCNVGYPEMFELLHRADGLLGGVDPGARHDRLRGEFLAYSALGHYARQDAAGVVRVAGEALESLAPDQLCEKGFAHILFALGLQMTGQWPAAVEGVQRALGDAAHAETTYHCRLLAALCFGYWNAADATRSRSVAKEYLALGRRLRFAESIDHGLYFSGLVGYGFNELETARGHFAEVVENPAISNMHNYLHSAYALALTHLALEEPAKAEEVARRVTELSLKTRQASMMAQSESFAAELALRLGRLSEAEKWLAEFDPAATPPILWRFHVPHFTRIRVLLALADEQSARAARDGAAELVALTERIHHTHFRIIALILHARALDATGDPRAALDSMAKAVEIALPGAAIRSFIDEGGKAAALLNQLELKPEALRFVGRILAGFRNAADETLGTDSTLNLEAGLLDPLSHREREVLCLLAGPLENKAIAEHLFISPGTVKRHTNSIYGKLAVHSRRAAVDKARGLGLLDK